MKLPRALVSRVVLSATICAVAACSGGGTVLSSGPGADEHVAISAGGSTGIARVLAGSSIALSAVLVSGSQNAVVTTNDFIWSAVVTNGQHYVSGSAGQMKPCGAVASTTGGVTTTYAPDYTLYVIIDPTNESNIIFSPPAVVPVVAGTTAVVTYPYCVAVSARAGSATGSIVIAVVDPQNPLQ